MAAQDDRSVVSFRVSGSLLRSLQHQWVWHFNQHSSVLVFLELQLQSQDFLSYQFHNVPLVPDYLIFLKHRRCNASNARYYSASSSSLYSSASHLQKKVNSKNKKPVKSGRVTTCLDSDTLSTSAFLHFSVSLHLCDSINPWEHRLELFPVIVS